MFCQNPRTYETRSALQCQLWTLGDNSVSMRVHQLKTYCSGGGYWEWEILEVEVGMRYTWNSILAAQFFYKPKMVLKSQLRGGKKKTLKYH